MSNMKCPFCQQEMICGGTICHYNPDCPIHDNPVPTEVLELLDCTRKALDVATKYIKHTQKVSPFWFNRLANETLDKIKTALEQKDVK